MKKSTLLAVVMVSACASQGPPPEPPTVRTLNATVRGMAGSNVRATAQANTVAGKTAVAVNLAGGASGATHPWHIHVGRCETNGPIFGAAAAYPALRLDGSGNATATATLDLELGGTESYYVNVHESPQNMRTIVACGDLR